VDSPETQRIISFCTGYGGIELGIKRTGLDVRTVAYVEIEAFACANLVAKIEQGQMDAAPIWTNLKTFDGRPFRNKVHGIIGGYPCQPFSVAGVVHGRRKGAEDPRHLWPYIEDHISTVEPLWCFFENVEGHLSLGFDEVFESLRNLGYRVEAGLFTAAEGGSRFKKARLFILACSHALDVQGGWPNFDTQGREIQAGQIGLCNRMAFRNEPQREWEEPRTVESGMGRTVDGFASRVDELRLLGNGVVPQTAELAFRTLWNKAQWG
jgi:site-specific DNA-cytosine methylase